MLANCQQILVCRFRFFGGKNFLVFIQESIPYERVALYLELFFLIFSLIRLETLQIKNLGKVPFSFSLKTVTQDNFQRKRTRGFLTIKNKTRFLERSVLKPLRE